MLNVSFTFSAFSITRKRWLNNENTVMKCRTYYKQSQFYSVAYDMNITQNRPEVSKICDKLSELCIECLMYNKAQIK